MKKVLIVTYYWPPSGGGGVQRWLKMSRYLHEFGWEPIIYTPENPAFDVKDPSLENYVRPGITVVRRPIFEPIEVFFSLFKLTGKKAPQQKDFLAQRKSSLFQRFSTWIRGNVLLPDPRVTWVRSSVRYLRRYVKENNIDAIITTGPPHSMHLIGRGVKKHVPSIVWLADFRDPWSEWDLWELLGTGARAMRMVRKMEHSVLAQADTVVSISRYHVARLEALGAAKAWLVPNGYDHADFEHAQRRRNHVFTIRHMGSVDDLRDPRPFMQAVAQCIEEHHEWQAQVRVEFYGPVNTVFRDEMAAHAQLKDVVHFYEAVPHKEVIPLYVSSTLLLLVLAHTDIAEGNTPGKMYEYMASGTPVLGIGPEKGDAAVILESTHSGIMIDRNNVGRMKTALIEHLQLWQQGENPTQPGAPEYSRKALAGKIADLLTVTVENAKR